MSSLEELYKEIIIEHYRNPRNRGELAVPPAVKADGHNPLCGDNITVWVEVENDTILDVAIGGDGCSISQASASMMTAAIKGLSLQELQRLTSYVKASMDVHEDDSAPLEIPSDYDFGDLEALKGVVKYPVRIKCALLSWNTLAEAVKLHQEASETPNS